MVLIQAYSQDTILCTNWKNLQPFSTYKSFYKWNYKENNIERDLFVSVQICIQASDNSVDYFSNPHSIGVESDEKLGPTDKVISPKPCLLA